METLFFAEVGCYNENKVKEMNMKKYYLFEMNMKSLNILAILILVLLFVATPLINPSYHMLDIDLGLFLITAIPYFILHEIIHSVAYVLWKADFKKITFGAHIEKGILCCLCKQNISKRNVLASLLAPFIVIGVITYILGMVTGNHLLILLSIANMSGSAGDLMMFYSLNHLNNFEFSEYDNPLAFGLYTSENLSHKKLWGLNYIGEANQLEKTTTKKVTISKPSLIFFLIIFFLFIVKVLFL